MTTGPEFALEVRNLAKAYGGSTALEDMTLTVRPGEVHALLGQNGCGKSTLVKALTGVVNPDSGTLSIYGRWQEFPIVDAHRLGIAVIHQDIGLVESMTVLENLGASSGYGTRLFFPVNERKERKAYTALMNRLGLTIDLDARVLDLSPAERSLLALVRAMHQLDDDAGGQIFILDEPTAALSHPEAARVLAIMRRVAELGSAVVFISHRIAEVMESCDRATVMRAGRDVVEVEVAHTTRSDLVAHMLGRRMRDFYPERPLLDGGVVRLRVSDLSGERVEGVSFDVHAGEVVGVTGLAGMGQEELPGLLAGAERPRAGSIEIDGALRSFRAPTDAIDAGVVLVPGNRLRDGVWLAGTAEENVTLPVLSRLSNVFGVKRREVRDRAQQVLSQVAVHPNRPDFDLAAFSGGNQQKIVFGKWLQLGPEILLLDEPTQGVDPGAAKELLAMALDVAAGGKSVVVFSGDHEQLAAICHRVIVLQHGRVVAELSQDELSEEAILHASESGALMHLN